MKLKSAVCGGRGNDLLGTKLPQPIKSSEKGATAVDEQGSRRDRASIEQGALSPCFNM